MSALWWFLVGWVLGAGFVLAVWWRPASLLRRQGQEIRRLRQALEETDAQLSGQFASAERMARMLVDQAGKR